MMQPDTHQDVFQEFALTEGEALVVAACKLWLMTEDRDLDPDADDRRAKSPVILLYAVELHRAFQRELAAADIPDADVASLLKPTRQPGWPAALRRALGDMQFEDMSRTVAHWSFVEGLLKTVTARDRAVLVAVEMAAFFPWPPGTKYEKGIREAKLAAIAEALPKMSPDFMRELDHELRRRARNLSLQANWKKLAAIGGGGAVLGLVTGGLAAPLIGGMVGGAMGLSGAAAVNAGLAAMGGGSLAAGGFGMAGGTMVVAGVAGVGAGAAGAGGTAVHQATASEVFAAAVKVDVLTEYMLVRGKSQPQKIRLVVAGVQKLLQQKESDVTRLEHRIAELERLPVQLAQTQELVLAGEDELEQLKKQLKDKEKTVKLLEAEVRSLKNKASQAEDAA